MPLSLSGTTLPSLAPSLWCWPCPLRTFSALAKQGARPICRALVEDKCAVLVSAYLPHTLSSRRNPGQVSIDIPRRERSGCASTR